MRITQTLALLLVAAVTGQLHAQEKLRLIVETDAGGDPDDEQSLVRFLVYASEWDIAGIIANRPTARPRENLNPVRTGLGIVQNQINAYGQVFDRLRENHPGFPTKQYLWDRTVAGYNDTDAGVNLILSVVDQEDARPVWFLNWGTIDGCAVSSLKRALDKVLAERGPDGYARFKNKIFLCSDDQFGEHTTTMQPPWRHWVYPFLPNMDGGRWYHRFGPLTATAGGFVLQRDVLTGHGPLGALYPTNTTLRQKEGDSYTFLYLIPTGMNDPMQPGWGSWAGRFFVRDDFQPPNPAYFWPKARDVWQGTTNRDNTLKRWAADLQNDFRARMDWCVKPFREANHHPVAVLNGDASKRIQTIHAPAGSTVKLSAAGSTDPDGNALAIEWILYPEAGTYAGAARIANPASSEASLSIPAEAAGKTIHVILAVRDTGAPPLASYRRAVVQVDAKPAAGGK
ncbi:MAG TPA: nucleoside hydrolase-like domain-containing protein [Verrucomicrobiae bacterium]|jgi:hypothetical protein